ncbi:transposase, partial [Shigella boydii]
MSQITSPATYSISRPQDVIDIVGFAPIFPDICYHLTHYKP